jgi:phosphomannomutase
MALKFGTSGIRGLNTEFSSMIVEAYIKAFIDYAKSKKECADLKEIAIGGDLRESTPGIQKMIEQSVQKNHLKALDCGKLPTPALALYCAHKNVPGIMITGSHIPADRNGIKFYWPWGEILKDDEVEINKRFQEIYKLDQDTELQESAVALEAQSLYQKRYLDFFAPYKKYFQGKKIVVYQHSTVSRDLWKPIFSGLGFDVIEVGRSNVFTPVDTETDEAAKALSSILDLKTVGSIFAVVSSDGDADRPFLCDENLKMVRGDSIGILNSLFLKADCVVTPVSTNTALEKTGAFNKVVRTQIGSPFVIQGMIDHLKMGSVIGFEANGGLMLASKFNRNGVSIESLPTRDSFLPILGCLALACEKALTLSQLVATLPPRYTDSDLLRGVDINKKQLVYNLVLEGESFKTQFIAKYGQIVEKNEIDGLRLTFENGAIIHFRPSGNAPEFRCYSEASTAEEAKQLVAQGIQWLKTTYTQI